MNKNYLLLLVAILMPLMTEAQTQTLVLWHADGSTTDIDLYTEPKLVFTDSKMLIKSTVLDMEYPAEEIVRFTYKVKETGIDATKYDADYRQQNDCIIFHQISSADRVVFYRSDGIRMPIRLIVKGGDAVLPLSELPRGIYIISVNEKKSKFIRK